MNQDSTGQFNEKAATQAAAFFLVKAGGKISYMKLLKLLYFADREAIKARGFSITHDQPYSMENGPILSLIYDLIKHEDVRDKHPCWKDAISINDVFDVSLVNDPGCIALSEHEVGMLETVWEQYGNYTQFELRDISHGLPEWEDPGKSSIPISLANIHAALGVAPEKAKQYEEDEAKFQRDKASLSHLFG